jgi:hypothetical protein
VSEAAADAVQRRHLAIVRRDADDQRRLALALEPGRGNADRHALPFVDAPVTWSADVTGIDDALAPDLHIGCLVGLATVRHGDQKGTTGPAEERLYLCEPLPGTEPAALERFVWTWDEGTEPTPSGLPAPLREALVTTLARLRSESPDEGAWPPFTLPGFHHAMDSVLEADAALRGRASFRDGPRGASGPTDARLRQVRAWSLSSVWVGPRSVLKLPNPLWKSEPAVTALVGRYAPDVVPRVLAHGSVVVPGAADAAVWMLMQPVRGEEARGADDALRLAYEIGELQRRLLAHEDELRASGMTDRHLNVTASQLELVWTSSQLDGLDAPERAKLPALDAWIRRKLREYANLRPPAVLTHGDLHGGNAIRRVDGGSDEGVSQGAAGRAAAAGDVGIGRVEDPFALIDWTDVAFAWPGVDMFTLAGFEADLDGEKHAALQRAYIEGLAGALGPAPERMVRSGVELSPVYHMVSYALIARSGPKHVGGEVDGAICYLVRLLLDRMERAS